MANAFRVLGGGGSSTATATAVILEGGDEFFLEDISAALADYPVCTLAFVMEYKSDGNEVYYGGLFIKYSDDGVWTIVEGNTED